MATATQTTTLSNDHEYPKNPETSSDEYAEADLWFWSPERDPVASEMQAIFNGTHSELKAVPVRIKNIRPSLTSFNLNTHGFEILKDQSKFLPLVQDTLTNFHDEAWISREYWPEITKMIRDQLGAKTVAVVSSTVRDDLAREPDPKNPRGTAGSFTPIFATHTDYLPISAWNQLHAMLPTFFEDNNAICSTSEAERRIFMEKREAILQAESDAVRDSGAKDRKSWSGTEYKGPRWMVFSVWRPLETVQRDPLAVQDYRSGSDFATIRRPYLNRPGFEPSYEGENAVARVPDPRKGKKDWYYIKHQEPEEVLVLKLFDSEAQLEGSKVAAHAIHSAFSIKGDQHLAARRSCEIRVIAIF